MRSADLSGVDAVRFSVGKGATSERREGVRGGFDTMAFIQLKLSPITTAVALTAFLAATAFVIFDSARTLADARSQLAVIGRSIANDIAHFSPDAVAGNLETGAGLHMVGASLGTSGLISENMATPHGLLTPEIEQGGIFSGIWQRGLGAYGLALLVAGLTWCRRRNMDMPDATRRYNYRTLAAAIPMGIACWTKSGKLIVCNQQYSDHLNLAGASPSYHDAVKKLIVGGYMKLVKQEDDRRLLELHRADGSCLMIDERPLEDGGFTTLVSDITDRKRVDTLLQAIREEQRQLARRYHEEKLKAEAASRSKTNFLAHLSHDIRTPLNHIIGFAELMRHQTYGPLGDPRYADYVQSIKTSGEHLLASFATILDLAELEGGQKVLRSDRVPVDDLLDTVAQRFRGQAQRAGLTFVLGERCGAVLSADRLGMQRMIGNIVDNAIRFTPAGGRVTLAAYAARDGVVLEITDTGLGMNEERLGSLTQPFALGDATFTREGMGPGLGISIARAIAELSGGNLAIDSSTSVGTTVAISLPLSDEMTVPHAVAA